MAKFLLNTAIVEDDFFSDSRLFAVGSALQGHTLCWWFNNLFGLNFIREPELDICIREDHILPKGSAGTLFDQVEEDTGKKKKRYYPVYRHQFEYFEASIFFYHNRIEHKKLIPEVKHADYLLLMQYASYVESGQDLFLNLGQVQGITWTSELQIEGLKSRRNLIM
jgi:hypothetical protein